MLIIKDKKNSSITTNKTDNRFDYSQNRNTDLQRNYSHDANTRPRNNTYNIGGHSRFQNDGGGNYFDNLAPNNFGGMQPMNSNMRSGFGNNVYQNPNANRKLIVFLVIIREYRELF